MIVGDLVSGAAKLSGALKNLSLHWDETKDEWRDAACRRFEEDHLVPLEPKVHLALDSIARLAEALERAQRECN